MRAMKMKRIARSAGACCAAVLVVTATVSGQRGTGPSPGACDGPYAYSAQHNGVAVLIAEHGSLVCERYADGITRDTPRALFSGTKGFVGMMAAAAVADGLLTLDERAADTLSEWRGDPLRSTITIRDLLSLSSGLETSGPQAAPGFADAVRTPAAAAPGTKFAYGPIVFQVFGAILQRKLAGRGLDPAPTAYLERRVLAPIGARVTAWGGPVAGPDPNLAAGASMSAADWAKFGDLVRLPALAAKVGLDPASYEAQFHPAGAYRGYGLTWWLATPLDASAREGLDPVARTIDLPQGARAGLVPADLVVAAGAGGQRLYVSRSRQLVVVRFAEVTGLAALAGRAQPGRARGSGAVSSGQYSDTEFVRRVLAVLPGVR